MRVRVEILRWEGDGPPKVVHAIAHESHSLQAVKASVERVIESAELPEAPDGYRIVTEGGTELYGWAGRQRSEMEQPETENDDPA
jgi:hypothetical protein